MPDDTALQAELVRLWQAGASQHSIARTLHKAESTILRMARRLGLPHRPQTEPDPTPAEIKAECAAIRETWTPYEHRRRVVQRFVNPPATFHEATFNGPNDRELMSLLLYAGHDDPFPKFNKFPEASRARVAVRAGPSADRCGDRDPRAVARSEAAGGAE